MARTGLKKWFSEDWVDIGAPKKDGKYQSCGRKNASKKKWPSLPKVRTGGKSGKHDGRSEKKCGSAKKI